MAIIGVTGHRVLAEVDTIVAGIDLALAAIEERFPSGPFTVMSALAEGADRLVARRALARPRVERLIAPLPLPEPEYLADFATEASRAEFRALVERAARVIVADATDPGREAAYAAAGSYIVRKADVLLAVWDGRPPQGPTGTGSVVAEARGRGVPLAWVHAGNRRPATMEPTSLGEEQGTVTFEGF